jgi:hypothetical protein
MSPDTRLRKVLLLTANPRDETSLRLQEEERLIKEQLRLAGYGHAPISASGATRPRDIQQALLDVKPQILHFSGHGGSAGLAFEDDAGGTKLVSGEALGKLLDLFSARYPVECVVLNACFSRVQAEEIVPFVDFVVGMSSEIGDEAALEFTVGFYKALGAGEPYEFAFELGCNAMQLAGIPEHLVPVLLARPGAENESPGLDEISSDDLAAFESDFIKLERFLESGWWKEADVLTNELMLGIAGKEEGDWLSDENLESFPCTALEKIDKLWLRCSEGRFGFTVQKAIWNALGGLDTRPRADGDMERDFGDRVGWRQDEVWLPYRGYSFSLSAPPGHLPRYLYNHDFGWWLGRSCLICTRLDHCVRPAHGGNGSE